MATAAMSLVMLAAEKAGVIGGLAPKHIVRAAVPPVDQAPEPVTDGLSTAAHFAYGAGNGALFAIVAPRLPGPRSVRGPVFGLALLAGSYGGWLPAAGLFPALHRQQPGRRATLLGGHLVYGAVLGWVGQPR